MDQAQRIWGRGISDSEAQTIMNATGGGDPGQVTSYLTNRKPVDMNALVQQQLELRRQAQQPAIDALELQIPNIQAASAEKESQLTAQREPLQQRYDNLLQELTRRETEQVGGVSTATSREFGRRGIPLSSGAFDEALLAKTNPIRQFFAGQSADVGLENIEAVQALENLIANLPIEETAAINKVKQQVANLISGASSAGIEDALALFNLEQERQQSALDRELTEKLRTRELDISDFQARQGDSDDPFSNLITLGEGQTLFDLASLQSIFSAPKTFKPTTPNNSSGVESYYGFSNAQGEWRLID